VPYQQALQEMLNADGLLVMQGANCNEQVPAKLYEYFRAGRPILGLTDPAGDTARVMKAAGVEHVALLESAPAVQAVLGRYLGAAASGSLRSRATPGGMSRQARSSELARLLDAACNGRAGTGSTAGHSAAVATRNSA
jgi:hypothetical protein